MKNLIVTVRDILAAFARCIVSQSPYPKVDNLPIILEDIRTHLISLGFIDELTLKDKYDTSLYVHKDSNEIYKILKSIKDNVPSFGQLNITKVELEAGITDPNDPKRTIKMSIVGRGIYSPRDRDFIDLDACIGNVYNIIVSE